MESSEGVPCDFCGFSSVCANKGKRVRAAEDGGETDKFKSKFNSKASENEGKGEEK